MEYCQDGSLGDYTKNKKKLTEDQFRKQCPDGSFADYLKNIKLFTEEQLRDIACCGLLGLGYLQSREIKHRVTICLSNDSIGYQTRKHAHSSGWLN